MDTDVNKKVQVFFSQFPLKKYEVGEIVIHPDTDPTGAFFIKKGFVKEYGISIEGTEITLHIFTPDSFFPMMWVISDLKNRYYYESLGNVEIYCAPKVAVVDFLKKNPDVLLSLTDRLLRALDKLTMRIEGISLNKASQKIVSILLYLVKHFGIEKGSGIQINYKFTHRDIGALAGITRETTSRELEKLEKEGYISNINQMIVINDINKVKEKLMM